MHYGWRARIGFIIPSHGISFDYEFFRVAPEGVAAVITRKIVVKLAREDFEKSHEEIEIAARQLGSAGAQAIVDLGVPPVLIMGSGYEKVLVEKIERAAGVPATTTAIALREALKRLNARKLVVITYYVGETQQLLKRYLEEHGFQVLKVEVCPLWPDATEIDKVSSALIYELAKKASRETPDADSILLCGGFRTLEIIDSLEKDLGKPVTSNAQASIWKGLQMVGVREPIKGCGRLLENL